MVLRLSCRLSDSNNFKYSCGGEVKSYNKAEVVNELKSGYAVLLGGCTHKECDKILGIKTSGYYYLGGHFWLAHGVLTRTKVSTTKKTVKYIGSATKPEQDFYREGWSVVNTDYILCNFGVGETVFNGYYLGDVFDVYAGPTYKEGFSKSGREGYYQYELTAVVGIRK